MQAGIPDTSLKRSVLKHSGQGQHSNEPDHNTGQHQNPDVAVSATMDQVDRKLSQCSINPSKTEESHSSQIQGVFPGVYCGSETTPDKQRSG